MRLNDTVAFHGQTDKDGDFSIKGLAPGTYYLRAGGFGTLQWKSDPVTIDAEPPRARSAACSRRDPRSPAAPSTTRRASPHAVPRSSWRTATADLIASLFTTTARDFRFTGLTPGDYRVGVLRPGGVFLRHAAASPWTPATRRSRCRRCR